ncbi:MAG: ABC transporter substrate-binding protein [Verrucomicrobia bacterium]|nr:ABC transporter substrate-binding protein [Verrucomicrobiota bacterium]MCH8528883.1 ABC transporter substrate-binding protein [Kiritimatiellia bacterium]
MQRRSEMNPPTNPDGSIPADSWPAEWFEAPRKASEMGITAFSESPMLAERRAAGDLPPLEERLCDDPIVIHPYEKPGRHGGTAALENARDLNPPEGLLRPDPEVRRVFPNFAESVEVSDDGRVYTITLRKGLRWSDGHPHTSEDYRFYFEDVYLNPELNPAMGPPFIGAEIRIIDELTFEYAWEDPQPYFHHHLALDSIFYARPAHFLKEFHAAYVDPEELNARARQFGFRDWIGFFGAMNSGRHGRNVMNRPVMQAFVLTRIDLQMEAFERNPFYSKVDPEGRQLPYIDRLEVHTGLDEEVIAARAGTGAFTFAASSLRTSDIPMFKIGESAGNHETFIWNRIQGADVLIQMNFTTEDEGLRNIFRDLRFRKALSLAIDRDEINEMIYFGRATPSQVTVSPFSVFFEEEFARAYADHDPAEAARLLDEMGVVDQNGDGRRNRPDGRPLNITLEWHAMETPKQETMELVTAHWRQIGIDINLRQVSGSLQSARTMGNMMDMTLWHADRTTDMVFPVQPWWFVPIHRGWESSMWPLWAEWYRSGGESGEEPIPEMLEVIGWWDDFRTNMDENRRIELGKKILAAQAENLWGIGTVSLAPQPVVVSTRLRNVPTRGYWGWDSRRSLPYFTESWYLREAQAE